MQVLTAQRVAELMPQIDVVSVMRALFESMARGDVVQQPQILTVLPGGSDAGDFITYAAALSDPQVFGAKLSPYLPHSTGDKVTAWTLLMSSADGTPLLLCDAMALTVERTAATTALAVDLLASREPQALAVIGSGPVALAHLRHVAALRPWSTIRCWSPAAASRAEAIEAALPGTRIASSLEEAVQGVRVVLLCTSSATPVLDPRKLDSGTLVTSISTNAPGAHEIPPESLPSLDVFCDYAATTPGTAAEMKNAREYGWSDADLSGDLAMLLTGAAKKAGRTAYFRSVGLGCEDIAIAAALLTCLQREKES